MSQFQVVKIKDIVVLPDRGRKAFNKIEEMAESIKQHGLINPIMCTESPDKPGKYVLVAGERRYRGAILAGLTEVPITIRPPETMSKLEQVMVELEENICRQDLTWQEQCELHRQIDEARKSHDVTWTQQKTAELVQLSPQQVGTQIALAKRLKDEPELKKIIKDLPMSAAIKVINRKDEADKAQRLMKQGVIKITTDLRLGDCRELIKTLPSASVDMLLTDPPYGLEQLEAIREGGSSKMSGHQMMSDIHNMEINDVLEMLRTLAPEIVRVCKPGAHCYVFAAFQYIGDFIKALTPLEFQPPVLIWHRAKPTTPGLGYNYLNTTEAIIMFHNPPRSKRLAKNMYNILEHPEVPASLRVYPTEKPGSLLKDLINQSTITGDTVLDLFAGSASTMKAARFLGRRSIGFEKNPESWQRAQLALSGETEQPEMPLIETKAEMSNHSHMRTK